MCSRTEPKTNAKTSSSIGTPTPKHNRGKRKYTCQESECHILGHRHLDHSDCRREQKHPQLSMPSSQKESRFPKDSPRKPGRSRLTDAVNPSAILDSLSGSSAHHCFARFPHRWGTAGIIGCDFSVVSAGAS